MARRPSPLKNPDSREFVYSFRDGDTTYAVRVVLDPHAAYTSYVREALANKSRRVVRAQGAVTVEVEAVAS